MTTELMTAADVLERAADLIEPEGMWTKGAEARSSEGYYASPLSLSACKFCMVGALLAVGGRKGQVMGIKALNPVIRGKPWVWNDRIKRTQAEVVAKLREAAILARTGEA